MKQTRSQVAPDQHSNGIPCLSDMIKYVHADLNLLMQQSYQSNTAIDDDRSVSVKDLLNVPTHFPVTNILSSDEFLCYRMLQDILNWWVNSVSKKDLASQHDSKDKGSVMYDMRSGESVNDEFSRERVQQKLDFLFTRLNLVLNALWERMHSFSSSWNEMSIASILPVLHTRASLLASMALYESCKTDNLLAYSATIKECLKICDVGILMGRRDDNSGTRSDTASHSFHSFLINYANKLHEELLDVIEDLPICKRRRFSNEVTLNGQIYPQNFESIREMERTDERIRLASRPNSDRDTSTSPHSFIFDCDTNHLKSFVERSVQPSLQEFYEKFLLEVKSVVLLECMEDWKAYNDPERRWGNLDNLRKCNLSSLCRDIESIF